MRKARAALFVVAGILLGLVFVDEFASHITYGDATQYEYMALSAAGSIACFAAALADWRPVRRADRGDRRLGDVRDAKAVVFSVVGAWLGLVAGFGYTSAPWAAHLLGFAFPVVFGLGAVACFRLALGNWRSPGRQLSAGTGVTSGG
jgi:hypothetical protein